MAHARYATRYGALALGATLAVAVALSLASPAHGFDATEAVATSLRFANAVNAAIAEGYRAAPALMLGLALAAGLPLLTVLARISRFLTRSPEATRLYRPARDDDADAEIDRELAVHGLPFVEVTAGGRDMRCAILRDMLRIGREDDNDIRIPSRAVHRYHAAIHREDYDDWRITDLSGVEGSNGLIVNGRRCCEARLHDGDLIELGPGRLRFRAGFL
jgi:hypothetical protein